MKHNRPLWETKGTSNTTAPIKANVSAQCERPYLELLGSEGKRERHSVRQRERQGGGTEKYISNILMLKKEQVDTMKQALKGKKGRKGTGTF